METDYLRRYKKSSIIFHWGHSVSFVILLVSGISMFVPGSNSLSGTSHCGAAVVLVAILFAQILYDPKKAFRFLISLSKWTQADIRWIRAAPEYYFGGPAANLPEQGYMNTGQKIWQFIMVITGVIFVITGAIMWIFKSHIGLIGYQHILLVHNIAFIIAFPSFLVHIYMGILHPQSKGTFRSMIDGKILPLHAQQRYPKWYDEIKDLSPKEQLEDQ